MQTILGSGGAIGIPLAKELKSYTDTIRLVARNPKQVNGDDELFPADLTKADEVAKAVAGSDIVYLTVGLEYNIKVWRRDWPLVMSNVINACLAENSKLVFLDNVYMYAATEVPHMTEEALVDPPSEKGKVRAALQDMIFNAISKQGLQAVIARSADFYGPHAKTSPLGVTVVDKFQKKQKAFWQANVQKIHSFTFTLDAARGTAMLGNTTDAYGQVWHLPTSSERRVGKDFIEMVAGEMDIAPRYFVMTGFMLSMAGLFVPIVRELKEMLYQYDQDYFFDSSKFEKRFSFRPTLYADGIKQMVKVDGT